MTLERCIVGGVVALLIAVALGVTQVDAANNKLVAINISDAGLTASVSASGNHRPKVRIRSRIQHVTVNGQVRLQGWAWDADDDRLTYRWIVSRGTVSDHGRKLRVMYTAPETRGWVKATFKVTEASNRRATKKSFMFCVIAENPDLTTIDPGDNCYGL